ncbi:MAG: hypothetical protein DMG30_29155 [Acidobacteria bacterium]|nr:MAG: hypothetical protein DMG30_29155 [Acidobacteriota bacterium]
MVYFRERFVHKSAAEQSVKNTKSDARCDQAGYYLLREIGCSDGVEIDIGWRYDSLLMSCFIR